MVDTFDREAHVRSMIDVWKNGRRQLQQSLFLLALEY